jgi:hypothetical protein
MTGSEAGLKSMLGGAVAVGGREDAHSIVTRSFAAACFAPIVAMASQRFALTPALIASSNAV